MKKALTFLFFNSLCVAFVHAQIDLKPGISASKLVINCDVDPYEPNDDPDRAFPTKPGDVHFGLICDETDIDWFLMEVPNNAYYLKVIISDCQIDYDLEIYDEDHYLIGSSYNRLGTDEVIHLPISKPGNYYAKVFGYKNSFDPVKTYAFRYLLTYSPKAVNNNSIARTQNSTSFTDINLYPNPATDYIQLKYTAGEEGVLTINIYDHVGRIMNNISELHGEGINTHQLDVSYLPNGFYMVEVIINNERQLKKLTVNKR